MLLSAAVDWLFSVETWVEHVQNDGWPACAYAIHSNGRIEVGPLIMNG